ncbi:hypothetical protein M0812_06575 [Anaeramoeba flamelloides]|uniref:Uncharacterized protein n=1 Tax=Anaeramoeba flamelloides TaxID=1746091 RepID=A0AAV8ADW6_9EUKA|nr:hypothetical protein M0812_06575 [Anaeramoeba flamelloides]
MNEKKKNNKSLFSKIGFLYLLSEKTCPLPESTDFVISGNNNIESTTPSVKEFSSGKISLVYASSLKTNKEKQIFQSVLKDTGEIVVNSQVVNSLKSTHEVNYNHYLIANQDMMGITWQSETKGSQSDRIFFKIFDSLGKNVTPEVAVNPDNYPSNRTEYYPTTAISTDSKTIAISWVEKNLTKNFDSIKLQYFKSANGQRIKPEAITVSQNETCYFYYSQSIGLLDQGIAIIWISKCSTQDHADVNELKLRIYDWDGKPVRSIISLGRNEIGLNSKPCIATDVYGKHFFVIWESKKNNITSISGSVFDYKGKLIQSIAHVNDNLDSQIDNKYPMIRSIGKNENAYYVIVWNSITNTVMDHNLHCKIYNSKIKEMGGEFKVNQNIKGEQDQPTLVATGTFVEKQNILYPEFIVSWSSIEQDPNLKGIFSRVFLSDSTPISDEFKINTQIEESQYSPEIISTSNSNSNIGSNTDSNFNSNSNNFFIAWNNVDQDSNHQIFGKQLKLTKIKMNILIENQKITEGNYWDFTLHDNTFNCDKQDIQLDVKLQSTNQLPEWLKWNQNKWRFSGTVPANVTTYTIVLNAKDPCGNVLQYKFNLQVLKSSKKKNFHWSLIVGIIIPAFVILGLTIASIIYLKTKDNNNNNAGYKEIIQNQIISSNISDTAGYSSSDPFFINEDAKL